MEALPPVFEVLEGMADLGRWLHRNRAQPAAHGLTVFELSALYYLSQGNDRPALLSERLHAGSATTSSMLRRLEKRGLVARQEGEQARTVVFALTPLGDEIRQETESVIGERAIRMFADWSDEDLIAFATFLRRAARIPVT